MCQSYSGEGMGVVVVVGGGGGGGGSNISDFAPVRPVPLKRGRIAKIDVLFLMSGLEL